MTRDRTTDRPLFLSATFQRLSRVRCVFASRSVDSFFRSFALLFSMGPPSFASLALGSSTSSGPFTVHVQQRIHHWIVVAWLQRGKLVNGLQQSVSKTKMRGNRNHGSRVMRKLVMLWISGQVRLPFSAGIIDLATLLPTLGQVNGSPVSFFSEWRLAH